MDGNAKESLTLSLKEYALSLGVSRVGIAPAEAVEMGDAFEVWLEKGYHAGMEYMARRKEERKDPRKVVPDARSVVVIGVHYFHPRPKPPPDREHGRVSCYAWGRDYHRVVSGMLRQLRNFILEREPTARVAIEVDSGPVLEKYWAEKAGIGWMGKNSCLIVSGLGSYVFLATLMTDLELEYDEPEERGCGDCSECMEACPTGAIVEPGVVDARKCISYRTVEHRGKFPDEARRGLYPWVFGCDMCQEACPWNRKLAQSPLSDFRPRPRIANPNLEWLANLTRKDYDQRLQGSAMRRAGFEGLRRNARAAMEDVARKAGS